MSTDIDNLTWEQTQITFEVKLGPYSVQVSQNARDVVYWHITRDSPPSMIGPIPIASPLQGSTKTVEQAKKIALNMLAACLFAEEQSK